MTKEKEIIKPEEEVEEKPEPTLTRGEAIKFKREEKRKKTEEEALSSWAPKTRVGKLVKNKELTDIDQILDRYRILEPEVVDSLLKLKDDLLLIGQSKGKFGGGKRRAWRQTQRKTAEGNVPTFSAMAIVGDENGHVGVGLGRAKENLPAREKSLRKAKLNIIKVRRGCGSFDCSCKEPHSVPVRVIGKCGSLRVVLIPAPQGTGLVVGDEMKKILKLAGIKDVYGKTFGQTRTTLNLAKACIEALKMTTKV
ncbi:30S ribosomal protein S5, partial [Candidatus Pacearchaeota archaeon CG10_big_fil_rev_8_21_14_0_10_35_13]